MKSVRSRAGRPQELIQTQYTSKALEIPNSFLLHRDDSRGPVSYSKIDFTKENLPEYEGYYAVVLDNVISPSECAELIKLAERSAGAGDEGVGNDGWQMALVSAGHLGEFVATDYRNSDRIIWDQRTLVRRLWERCVRAEGLRKDLGTIDANPLILGRVKAQNGHRWKFTRLNERMRFLRYGKGQFFKEHCDGCYQTNDGRERTYFTLHLYLNDSLIEFNKARSSGDSTSSSGSSTSDPEGLLRGGATTFYSMDMMRRLDVDPKAGRVLIFQHAGLLHSGDEVLDGVKYTMRTDLLYEFDAKSESPKGRVGTGGRSGRGTGWGQ